MYSSSVRQVDNSSHRASPVFDLGISSLRNARQQFQQRLESGRHNIDGLAELANGVVAYCESSADQRGLLSVHDSVGWIADCGKLRFRDDRLLGILVGQLPEPGPGDGMRTRQWITVHFALARLMFCPNNAPGSDPLAYHRSVANRITAGISCYSVESRHIANAAWAASLLLGADAVMPLLACARSAQDFRPAELLQLRSAYKLSDQPVPRWLEDATTPHLEECRLAAVNLGNQEPRIESLLKKCELDYRAGQMIDGVCPDFVVYNSGQALLAIEVDGERLHFLNYDPAHGLVGNDYAQDRILLKSGLSVLHLPVAVIGAMKNVRLAGVLDDVLARAQTAPRAYILTAEGLVDSARI